MDSSERSPALEALRALIHAAHARFDRAYASIMILKHAAQRPEPKPL